MTRRERTVLLVGALAIGGAVTARGLREVRQEAAARRLRVEALALAVASQDRTLGELPALESSLHEVEGPAGDSLAAAFLSAHRDSDALAELSGLARRVIQGVKGALEATEALPDTSGAGPVRPVSLRVVFTHDLAGILDALRDLESRQPLVRVSSFGLHAMDPGGAEVAPETIRAELGLRAWYRTGKEAAR